MPVHIHTLRACCAAALGLILAVILLGVAYAPPRAEADLASVTGRVTCGGHPPGKTLIVFAGGGPRGTPGADLVGADGSFRLRAGNFDGLVPATYRIYFLPFAGAAPDASVDRKYLRPETSDLRVRLEPGRNDVAITLPGAARGPTLARHP